MAVPFGHSWIGLEQSYDTSIETLRLAKKAGARIFRITADMRSPTVGIELEIAVDLVREQGMEALVCVTYAPEEMGEYHQVPLTTDDRAEWANRVGQLAARNIGRVCAYEVWNEPNNGGPDGFNLHPHPGRYVDLLNRTYRAIKRADKDALVITGGTSPHATDASGFSPVDWQKALYKGPAPRFDGWGHHPYSYPWPASTAKEWNAAMQTLEMAAVTHWCEAVLGRGMKPAWATEVNFPSYKDTPRDKAVDEHTQILRMADLVHLWRSWEWTGPLIWFGVFDTDGTDPADRGALHRKDKSAKLVVPWYRALASVEG